MNNWLFNKFPSIQKNVKSLRESLFNHVYTVGIAAKNVYAKVESRILFRVRMEKIERVPTGIPGLDPLIEGGFHGFQQKV
jgi:hypothetical protein